MLPLWGGTAHNGVVGHAGARGRINLNEAREVALWTTRIGLTEGELAAVVSEAGPVVYGVLKTLPRKAPTGYAGVRGGQDAVGVRLPCAFASDHAGALGAMTDGVRGRDTCRCR